MQTMTATERFYRYQCAAEDLKRITDRVMAIQEGSIEVISGDEHVYLDRFHAVIIKAIAHLEDAIAETRSRSAEHLLEMQLIASLELIGRSPEKMRRDGE